MDEVNTCPNQSTPQDNIENNSKEPKAQNKIQGIVFNFHMFWFKLEVGMGIEPMLVPHLGNTDYKSVGAIQLH